VTAHEAVRHAALLAVACGARLTVVSAYTRREGSVAELIPEPDSWMVTDSAAANEHVEMAQTVARELGVERVGARTEPGDPSAVLIDLARELEADLIVVGSMGMAAPTRFVLGSVPNRVSHHADCDVIIVRTGD
jgi:nucleotide-binding universal stress UspA family protein